MEGYAGTGQLSPDAADHELPLEGSAEESTQPDAGTDQPLDTDAEGAVSDSSLAEPVSTGAEHRPSRLGRSWGVVICVVLVLLGAGAATGGYFALRSHQESQAIARAHAAAIEAAKDCVSATQAPDATAVPAAQAKIIECATGAFAAQAEMYSGVLMQAYQAANVQVQVSDMRAAVERDNGDGSVDLLVALRVKIDNAAEQGREVGYRLRVKMAPDEGQYKVANLDQVAK